MKTILRLFVSVILLASAGASAQTASSSGRGSSGNAYGATVQPSSTSPDVAMYGEATGRYGSNLRTILGSLQGGPSAVFVVPIGEMSLPDLLSVNEDLTVMARILERTLQQANLGGSGGFSYSFAMPFPGGGFMPMAPNLYLQGYGALFTLNVDFPLSPVAQDEEPTAPKEQTETDPLWQEMRQDLFEPQRPGRQVDPTDNKMQEYSAQKVESLKAALIGALKHAANIRMLKPEEAVVITVMGPTIPGQLHSVKSIPGTDQFEVVDNQGRSRINKERLANEAQLTAPTVLMVKAKAADIDALSEGDLSVDQFRQRVTVLTYPDLGHMVNSAASSTSLFIGGRRSRR